MFNKPTYSSTSLAGSLLDDNAPDLLSRLFSPPAGDEDLPETDAPVRCPPRPKPAVGVGDVGEPDALLFKLATMLLTLPRAPCFARGPRTIPRDSPEPERESEVAFVARTRSSSATGLRGWEPVASGLGEPGAGEAAASDATPVDLVSSSSGGGSLKDGRGGTPSSSGGGSLNEGRGGRSSSVSGGGSLKTGRPESTGAADGAGTGAAGVAVAEAEAGADMGAGGG
jgi:hypothetical protein